MELPAQFGKYELLEFLGGGMSHVYRARDSVIGRTVAVKILTEAACQEADAKARFLREAKTAGNIVHENIINIFDFGVENDRPYMVMEFLHGQDLRQAIQSDQTGDLRRKLETARGLARALEHIHSLGIVHRDIKPDNVNIDPNGKVKLMDFGIAKSQSFNITRAGFTLGTPSYMAPEQVRGQQVTPLVDIYAFGLVLIELLTGQKPVQGASIGEVFTKILTQPVDLKPLEEKAIPEEIIGLIRQMVEKDPAQRIQTMIEVRRHLDAILEGLGRQPAEDAAAGWEQAEQQQRAIPWRTISLGAGGVLLAALVIWIVTGGTGGGGGAPGPAPEGMVLIPAGAFLYGETSSSVRLPAFYIDKTEVPVAQYSKFAKARGLRVPAGAPDEPATGITIDEARQYAEWAGKRLPTMQEWEKAARGEQGFLYPWGNEPDPTRGNFLDNPKLARHAKMPVNSMPEGASPYGVLHMAGNVRELVLEFGRPSLDEVRAFGKLLSPSPTPEESWCVTRGGSYEQPMPKNVNRYTYLTPVRYTAATIGFRCVKDVR